MRLCRCLAPVPVHLCATLHFRTSALGRNLLKYAAVVALVGASIVSALAQANDLATMTPIKHVIVIIGENRTFDHVFATFEPVNKGESVWNLLSEGIVNPDGSRAPTTAKPCNIKAPTRRPISWRRLSCPT